MRNPSVKFILIVLAVGLASAKKVKLEPKPSSRLVGAPLIGIAKAPFAMQLRFASTGQFQCGGSLITPRFVVTAAHCVQVLSPEDLVVVGGSTTSSGKGIIQNVQQIFVHPKFSSTTVDHDIAILKLENDMVGENIETIPLYDKSLVEDDMLEVYGWGKTHSSDKMVSEYLGIIRIPVVSQDKCVEVYGKLKIPITDSMLCAFKPGLMDTCNSDSGGPAVFKGKLAGVVSWGKECGSQIYPGVYTRIDVIRDFIEECLQK